MTPDYNRVVQWAAGPVSVLVGLGAAALGHTISSGQATEIGTFAVGSLVTYAAHHQWLANLPKWWDSESRKVWSQKAQVPDLGQSVTKVPSAALTATTFPLGADLVSGEGASSFSQAGAVQAFSDPVDEPEATVLAEIAASATIPILGAGTSAEKVVRFGTPWASAARQGPPLAGAASDVAKV